MNAFDGTGDIVIPSAPPKPGWPCPSCHGMGTMCDGSISFGPDGVRCKLPTKCYLCKGSGRVNVTAIP